MSSQLERIVSKYDKQLNNPDGDSVLQYLEEGESFLLQTPEYLLRVTKCNGKAVVDPVEIPVG